MAAVGIYGPAGSSRGHQHGGWLPLCQLARAQPTLHLFPDQPMTFVRRGFFRPPELPDPPTLVTGPEPPVSGRRRLCRQMVQHGIWRSDDAGSNKSKFPEWIGRGAVTINRLTDPRDDIELIIGGIEGDGAEYIQ